MTEETCSRVGMSLICWKRWEHVSLLRIRWESTRYISLRRVHSRDRLPRQQRFPRSSSSSEFAIRRSIDDHHGETHGTLFGSIANSLFSSLFLFHSFWICTIVIGRKNRFLPLNLLLILDDFFGLLRSYLILSYIIFEFLYRYKTVSLFLERYSNTLLFAPLVPWPISPRDAFKRSPRK